MKRGRTYRKQSRKLTGVKISRSVKSAWKDMVSLRRTFHKNPELAFEERETAAVVADQLKKWGYGVEEGIAGTGVCGFIKGKKKGRVVAVRADMDALPVQEKGGKEYASRNKGIMHACGHDGHVSIVLQVAGIVAREKDALNGGVKFIFQPAEERPGGALPMIAAGVLKDPDVDFILALHLWSHLPTGIVGLRGGPMMASADILEMKVTGKGGHGAAPHQTVDAILVASRIVDALQSVVSRSIDPTEPSVLTVGTITGGRNFNVIAEEVNMTGTTRAFSDKVRKSFPGLIRQVARGIARAHGAGFRLNYIWGYPPLENNSEIARIMTEEAARVVGPNRVIDPGFQMTAEDMSYFLKEVPGCFFFVGAHNPGWEKKVPHHSPWFDFDERAMMVGAEIILRGIKTLTTTEK